MRTCWIAAALLAVAAACGAGAQACSSAVPEARSPEAPAGVTTPLTLPVTDPPHELRDPPDSAAPEGTGLDFENLAPLLARPELEAAARACEAEDFKLCSSALGAYLQGRSFDEVEAARFQLLLGTLLEKADDPLAASVAYERALSSSFALSDYAALGLGRCLAELGRFDEAAVPLARVPKSSAAFAAAEGLRAELTCRTGTTEDCLALAKSFVRQSRKPGGWAAQGFRIAGVLVTRLGVPRAHPKGVEQQLEALALVRALVTLAPGAAERFDASKLERTLLDALPEKLRAEKERLSPSERLERAEALQEARRHEEAIALAEPLAIELGQTNASAIACRTRLLLGKAQAGLKRRLGAMEHYAALVKYCKDQDLRAWALYLGGRAAFQEARYPEAERLFARLEREAPRHRLADDARLYRAHSQREMGVDDRFNELLSSMHGDYPNGDMTLDGVFLLALRRMEKHDWTGAAIVLERAQRLLDGRDVQRGPEHSGRERYFEARARIETGEVERGLAQYEALITELPLSYYMLHAYTRLAEHDPERSRQALERALATAADAPFVIEHRPVFSEPGFERVLELFRQGNFEAARAEMDLLNVMRSGDASVLWGVSLLFARAGSARHSHALPRWQLHDWLERWPAGPWRQAWELAFPRPHIEAVTAEAKRQGIEPQLIYAIMREESAFDPDAVSPANAYGLMQIISPTARRFGKEAGLPHDRRALTTPLVSIAIGTRVLSNYMQRFPEDPLLAIPGYNAGPGRPLRWARDWPSVDFDVWVELIPYRETRRYTKRVLASRAAYGFLYYSGAERDPLRLPLKLSPSTTGG